MKKLFLTSKLLVILLIGSTFFFCFSDLSFAQPSIRFKEIYYDFGEIKTEPAVHNFEFKNVGCEALTITRIRSTCGCVATNLSGENFQADEKGEIEVLFRPNHTEGLQEKSIFVHSDDPDFPIIKLTIRAVIVGPAEAGKAHP